MILIKCAVALVTATHILEAAADNIGQWGPTVQFPLVPAAAAVVPQTGKLLVWSADDDFDFNNNSGITLTASYDLVTKEVSTLTVSNTDHDMFCPGISKDFNGRLVVTGGNTAPRTSIYDPNSSSWIYAHNMTISRGYQASTILTTGEVFTIGGSWSGGVGGKNGEIYNPNNDAWTLLSGCPVAPMLTADKAGVYRADNHGWLFGWKEGSVFQAGPSRAMNWYGTSGTGSTTPAGTRGSDSDAMCGIAVMYDAVAGKILTTGGSPSYNSAGVPATKNANIITIGAPFTTVNTEQINSMSEARSFANAVVLPDGKVFITGGQTLPQPFSDADSSMDPELWDPTTTKFVKMATLPTPRNYHSVALLMPDATVFNGGGGLCGSGCAGNHPDGQFFSPPYLFESDGKTPAQRPTISKVSSNNPMASDTIAVTVTDIANTCNAAPTFSLIRIGSVTHSVDTDQRRVPLTPTLGSAGAYTLSLPADPGVLMPGYWYLFALACGVPSEAQTILIRP
ncbi:copper radical oxidase [Elaphomyces granulatus]